MKHKITIDKENKVLKLEVSIPKKKLHRDPNARFDGADAWQLVKNTKVKGYTVEFAPNPLELDNYGIFRHEGDYLYPLKEVKTKAPKPAKKPPVQKAASPKKKTASKIEDAKD
jgi:hypothetical protein